MAVALMEGEGVLVLEPADAVSEVQGEGHWVSDHR